MSATTLLEKICGGPAYLTPSCTAALELACMMILEPGDEVIMPSWAFPSCANAVILRGAIPVFVDVDVNLNLNPGLLEQAKTSKTKAVLVIHYAGVKAGIEIAQFCQNNGLYLIEDAAQAIGNWEVVGDFGCMSFHKTKNVSCDQGGALILGNEKFREKTEIMMHCGTDKGTEKNWSWLDVGSQYIMSIHQERVLEEQLERLEEITESRLKIWNIYNEKAQGIKAHNRGNGHFFWFYAEDKWQWVGGDVTSHFEALHNTIPGRKYGRTAGECPESLMAQNELLKLNTGVSEEKALENCELLWGSATTRNIL